jgi:redox-sensing transcriptional repressor
LDWARNGVSSSSAREKSAQPSRSTEASGTDKIGRKLEGIPVRDIELLERDIQRDHPDIVVLTVPGEEAQKVVDRVVKAGVKAILNFAPAQLHAPADVAIKTVNMAMELEGLSFALTNRD